MRAKEAKVLRPTFEVEALQHHGRWGSLEIWAWLWGLFFAVHLIGFPIALPLFVFLYIKWYGGSWVTAHTPHRCYLGFSLRRVRRTYSTPPGRSPGSGFSSDPNPNFSAWTVRGTVTEK